MIDAKVEFLRARLDEDEAAAGRASPAPWRYDPTKVNSVDRSESVFAGERGPGAITVASTGPADDPQSMADARHIARHHPDRVLRDVMAKRRILSDYQTALYLTNEGHRVPTLVGTGFAVHHLLEVYTDHEDFDPSWLT